MHHSTLYLSASATPKAAGGLMRQENAMHLEHYEKEEFRDWADDMSPRLTTMMDVLRHMIGSAIIISPHPDSLGRELGSGDGSAHNIDLWGEVLAADWFIPHVTTRGAVEDVVNTMRKIGFTGIGVYTDTVYLGKPLTMFHGDVRPTRKMGDPATWGRVWDRDENGKVRLDENGEPESKYTSLMAAIQSVES